MLGDGQWHCWEYYMKANSAVGAADGVHRFWLDGVEVVDASKGFPNTNLDWSDSGSSTNPRHYWNYVQIGGNNNNQFSPASQQAEQWYALDDVVVYTPMTLSDPKCNGKCTSGGRLPLGYVIGAGSADATLPTAPARLRIR
jgi:hypothetical protein